MRVCDDLFVGQEHPAVSLRQATPEAARERDDLQRFVLKVIAGMSAELHGRDRLKVVNRAENHHFDDVLEFDELFVRQCFAFRLPFQPARIVF